MDKTQYKQIVQNTFNTVATGYECEAMSFFNRSAALLPNILQLSGDEQVLDVATGTGIAVAALSPHLPEGKIIGIDFSKGMLAQAQKKVDENKLLNVELKEMDMQSIEFPDNKFDVANCSFGIFFVEEMEDELAHIVQKVKPGGKVICCAFQESSFQPHIDIFLDDIKPFGLEQPTFRWKNIGTEKSFKQFYQTSNLTDIQIHRFNVGYYLKDEHVWWEVVWNAGFRGVISSLSEEQLAAFKQTHLQNVRQTADERGVYLNIDVLFALGIKT